MFRSIRTILRDLTLNLNKVHFCKINQWKYIVISAAVLWQHVFQAVVCVLRAAQRATEWSVGMEVLNLFFIFCPW
jgi:hypothetical protein